MPDHNARGWRAAMTRVPFIDQKIRALRRTDEIERLQQQLEQERRQATGDGPDTPSAEPSWTGRITDEGTIPFLEWRPPGHYYSPIPSMHDVVTQEDRIFGRPDHLDGFELNEDAQRAMLQTLAPLINDVAFNVDPRPDSRYFTNNPSYGHGDGSVLQAFLRHLRPRRYVEVGSGWTTALALDVNERWLDGRLRMTCIEPYPDDLRRLVRPGDDIEVIVSPVQDVDLSRFTDLESGDILFIDCSHVVKTGSDAHHLVTRVLPVVPSGVYIHIHDMFWPFEYPRVWVDEGRVWTEAYLLHAFLLFNKEFEVILFNDWMGAKNYDFMVRHAPSLAQGAGGALWLRRL